MILAVSLRRHVAALSRGKAADMLALALDLGAAGNGRRRSGSAARHLGGAGRMQRGGARGAVHVVTASSRVLGPRHAVIIQHLFGGHCDARRRS
jgi:hypothetical protein